MSEIKRDMSGKIGESALGSLVTDDGAKRNAVHIAVIPIVAGETLAHSTRVLIREGKAYVAEDSYDDDVGIVDPFLKEIVREGDRFWLFLNPGMINSLRHEWDHPSFDGIAVTPSLSDSQAAASREWLKTFLIGKQADYEDIDVDRFVRECDEEGGVCFSSERYVDDCRGRENEIALHVENVLGRKMSSGYLSFNCAC